MHALLFPYVILAKPCVFVSFRYFLTPTPFTSQNDDFCAMDILKVFALINDISMDYFIACFEAGGKNSGGMQEIREHLWRAQRLYNDPSLRERFNPCVIISYYYALNISECGGRKFLQQLDGTVIPATPRNTVPFVPDRVGWRRRREVQRLIGNGVDIGAVVADTEFAVGELRAGFYYRGRFISRP